LRYVFPQKIESIRYAARGANNKINVGGTYKLLYYDDLSAFFQSLEEK
jgi:hypothetical protein